MFAVWEVGVLHDYFYPEKMATIDNEAAQTEWTHVMIDEHEYLNFNSVFFFVRARPCFWYVVFRCSEKRNIRTKKPSALHNIINSSEPKLWNRFLLLAIDGSKVEIPNSVENRERFGKSNNQYSELGQIRALESGMYEILNQFYLDIEISHISTSETELAKKNLNHLKRMNIKQPVLVIFDRGYPWNLLIFWKRKRSITYSAYPPMIINLSAKIWYPLTKPLFYGIPIKD